MMGGDIAGFCGGAPVAWAFSTRSYGNMSFSSGDTSRSLENRACFLAGLGISVRELVVPRQVHGSRIELCGIPHRGMGAEPGTPGIADTDALITREKRLALGVMTADCLPVLIIDPVTPAVAVVHAGWRSTAARLAARTVERMSEECGSDPMHLRCLFGPAIRPCCYEIGGEMKDVFPESVRTVGNTLRLDLADANRRQLMASGVAQGNIFDTCACTCCAPEGYFSFRREKGVCGRMLSVIMLL